MTPLPLLLPDKKCVVCGKPTWKTLFKKAIVHTPICSEECLVKFWRKKVRLQQTFGEGIGERDYWFD